MARPERRDVDYFPFYIKEGKTLFILESKYGCKGTGFFTNVLRFLCHQPDHHFCIKDDADRLYFFSRTHCDELSGMDMLLTMSKTGKISSLLWVSYQVIASQDLLDSIKGAYECRKTPMITMDQIIVSFQGNSAQGVFPSGGNPQEPIVSSPDNPHKKRKEKKRKETIYSDAFLMFWKNYPKRVGKDAAWKAWKSRNEQLPEIEIILSAINTQSKSEQWRKDGGQFIPNPATWINQGRWEDEIGIGNGRQETTGRPQRQTPYSICSRCGAEYIENDVIEADGVMICPHCPEAKEQAKKVFTMMKGIGKPMPGGR